MTIATINNVFKIGNGATERYFGQIKTDILKDALEKNKLEIY